MKKIKKVNDRVWEYLQNINPERWARAHFPGNRYFLMTSNSAESINSMSRFARKMSILMLIEYFRATMQQWSFQKRNVAGTNILYIIVLEMLFYYLYDIMKLCLLF